MQLSRFTDYTLRVLFYVAANNDRLVTLAEIASFYDISIEHLRKVVHALSKSNYLDTYRGKHGGFKLARAASDINLAAVIIHAEGNEPLINCDKQPCLLTGFCSLQVILQQAQEAFLTYLSQYTLADLIKDSAMRDRLLIDTKELNNF